MEQTIKRIQQLKDKTLEKIVSKYGNGIGHLEKMKLSIWDVRNILYEEFNKIVKEEFKEAKQKLDEECERITIN